MRKFLIITLITFLNFNFSQNPLETSDYKDQKKWVDSVYNSLNQEEKIGSRAITNGIENGFRER